jgi:hypothetical protein
MMQDNYIQQFIYDLSVDRDIINKKSGKNVINELFNLFENLSINEIENIFIDYSIQKEKIKSIIEKNYFNNVFYDDDIHNGLSNKDLRYYKLQYSLEKVYFILNKNTLLNFINIDKSIFDNITFINNKNVDLSNKEDFSLALELYKKLLDI